jgi:hypothetical protein
MAPARLAPQSPIGPAPLSLQSAVLVPPSPAVPALLNQPVAESTDSDPEWEPDEEDARREQELEREGVRVLRRTSRIPVPVLRPDSVPEDVVAELERRGFNLRGCEQSRPREPRWEPGKVLAVDTDEDGVLRYLVRWAGYDDSEDSWEPVVALKGLNVEHEFWIDYYLKNEDEMVDIKKKLRIKEEEVQKKEEKIKQLQGELSAFKEKFTKGEG